ncbi:MAG: hypothetical protein ACNS60_15970 [Candidatus Cyclobacteriaceae bacterium M2_1C_046]
MLESILTLLSVVIGAVAYLIRQLIIYLKQVSNDISDLKNTITLIKSEYKGTSTLMNDKFDYLNARVNRLEKISSYMKDTDGSGK